MPKQTSHSTSPSLLDVLRERRSRRFACGMRIEGGALEYTSQKPAVALTEHEEAMLCYAGCGITGRALADLSYKDGEGGNIMAGLIGRTIASGDGIQSVALVVSNDDATFLLRRPVDFSPEEIKELIELGREDQFVELYRRSRVRIHDHRVLAPLEPMFNINVNRWSLNAPGTSYFLPINDLTLMYINGLLEIFNEHTGAFVLDERAGFLPAGVGRFAERKGGHLRDDPRDNRILTIASLENLVAELVTIEQGMLHQNLSLMTQSLGLGGFSHFAAHPSGWFESLGFTMGEMSASRFLGAGFIPRLVMRLLGRDVQVKFPLGMERDGNALLQPYCPPYFSTMRRAVEAVLDLKFGERGIFRTGSENSAWREPANIASKIPKISEAAVEATVAYCEYVYQRYGRFPAHLAPYRTVLGYQACHIDVDFYEQFYSEEALSRTQHEHFDHWHDGE
jgi:hypothetical protein